MELFQREHRMKISIEGYFRPEIERSLRDLLRQPLIDALHQLVDNARQASPNSSQMK